MKVGRMAAVLGVIAVLSVFPSVVLAHRSGCHNLHTCPSDSNTYVCGDLGYPCDGSTSVSQIKISSIHVPLVIEKAFLDTFGRKPTDAESKYWKARFRNDKDGLYKIRRTMAWHKADSSFGPKVSITVTSSRLAHNINALFRSVYGRDPSLSENQYWLTRVKDKPTEDALRGAMAYHKNKNLAH